MSDTLMFVIMFSGTFILVGIVFFIIGIVKLNNIKKKEINCTSTTYGKVIDIVRSQSYDGDSGSSCLHPVFEYKIGELKFIKQSVYGSYRSKYTIGEDVKIYYNPENYDEYYIAGDSLPKIWATITTIMGIGAIMIAIVFAILILNKTISIS